MLRVRERMHYPESGEIQLLSYIRYECSECGKTGGLAITEEEAAELWN